MIEVKGKRITDECQYCGEILECKLFTSGHGINCDRNNVSEMVNCQMEHRSKRMAEERQKECCGTCGCSCYNRDEGYMCDNDDSEYYGDYVEYRHSCEEYEPRNK